MLVTMHLPGVLRSHAGGRADLPVQLEEPATLARLLERVAAEAPALERRIRDETGALRRHVNLYVGDVDARAVAGLATPLSDGAEVLVVASVAGG